MHYAFTPSVCGWQCLKKKQRTDLGAFHILRTSRVFFMDFGPPPPHVTHFPISFTWIVTLSLIPPPPLARDVICERPLTHLF